jgi:hypothetical protein
MTINYRLFIGGIVLLGILAIAPWAECWLFPEVSPISGYELEVIQIKKQPNPDQPVYENNKTNLVCKVSYWFVVKSTVVADESFIPFGSDLFDRDSLNQRSRKMTRKYSMNVTLDNHEIAYSRILPKVNRIRRKLD